MAIGIYAKTKVNIGKKQKKGKRKMRLDKNYEKKVRKILKTYNSILVKCKNAPQLSDKNIIMVDNMDSMVNAQIETKKPILYFEQSICTSFILLDGMEAYIYVVKANPNIQSDIEHDIKSYEIAKNTFVKDILSKLERILISGNTEKDSSLNESELNYLSYVKELAEKQEKIYQENNSNIENTTKQQMGYSEQFNEYLKQNENIQSLENLKNRNSVEQESANGLYLVPVKKKKFGLFNRSKRNKKARRII